MNSADLLTNLLDSLGRFVKRRRWKAPSYINKQGSMGYHQCVVKPLIGPAVQETQMRQGMLMAFGRNRSGG
jgi:hypothetical protein